MDDYSRLHAENELRFRTINEKVEELGEELFDDGSEAPRVYDFVCECDDAHCTERIAMTIAEYEALRAHAKRFVVAPAAKHVNEAIERVVDRSSRYWVVEKTGEAAEIADADDPRA